MGHDVIKCPVCGSWIMEGRADWCCGKCDYKHFHGKGDNLAKARKDWESGATSKRKAKERHEFNKKRLLEIDPPEEHYYTTEDWFKKGKKVVILYTNTDIDHGYIVVRKKSKLVSNSGCLKIKKARKKFSKMKNKKGN